MLERQADRVFFKKASMAVRYTDNIYFSHVKIVKSLCCKRHSRPGVKQQGSGGEQLSQKTV